MKDKEKKNDITEKDSDKLNKEKKNNSFDKKDKLPIYIGFPIRITFFIILLLISVIISLYCAKESFEFTDGESVNYTNGHSTRYKVYLKENNFYESDYLDENRVYIASLIDYIDIDFQYKFNIDKNSNINFDYDVIGKLVIQDEKGKVFLEKEYNLLNEKTEKLNNGNSTSFDENVKIDYGYYNQLASSFKSTYGLDTISNLEVVLRVNKHSDEMAFNDDDKMILTIPLSEKTVNIEFKSNDSQDSKYVSLQPKLEFNKLVFIIELIFVLASCYLIYKVVGLLTLLYIPKSKYDKYIAKILRSYDRLIVITKTKTDFKDKNIIEIDSFEELLDVRDNLKLPILYHEIIKHQKSCFYIKDHNDIYLVNLKAVDMEDNQIDKEKLDKSKLKKYYKED